MKSEREGELGIIQEENEALGQDVRPVVDVKFKLTLRHPYGDAEDKVMYMSLEWIYTFGSYQYLVGN